MWIWFAIPIGAGIAAVFVAVARRSSMQVIYVGIVERGAEVGTVHSGLQVRTYVDETLVRELISPSRLFGRMSIRETNTSVPLTFVRAPQRVPLKIDEPDDRQGRVNVLPVIFAFDPPPDLVVHSGQFVDVYISER